MLAVVSGLLTTAGSQDELAALPLFLAVVVVLPAGMMACWQHVAAGPTTGRLRERFGQAAIAFLATLLLGGVQLMWLGLAAGLPD